MKRLALLAVLAATAACGTTVPGAERAAVSGAVPQGAAAPGQAGGDGLGDPAAPAPAPGITTTPADGSVPRSTGGSGPVAVVPQGPGATTAPGRPAASARPTSVTATKAPGKSGATTSGKAAALPVGVTATQINVGFPYDPGSNQALAAAGASSLAGADQKDLFTAVAKDINTHGGIDGKQINLVIDTVSDSGQTRAQADDEDCAYFTQDHQTYAVLVLPGDEEARKCLEKGGVTAMVNENLSSSSQATFRQHPTYVEPGSIAYDRGLRTLVSSLVRQNWFSGWNSATASPMAGVKAVVGVVYVDDGAEGASMAGSVKNSLLPALATAGHPVDSANVIGVTAIDTSADYSSFTTQAASAALKLESNGVTHVVLADTHGGLMEFTVPAADKQNYFPRYGFTTDAGAQANLDAGTFETAKDLHGAMGIGWFPNLDLPAAANPPGGAYSTPATKHCLAVLSAAGITFGSSNASSGGLAVCDDLYTLKQVIEAGGPTVTTSSWTAGIAALGRQLTSAISLAQSIGPDHRDTVDGVRDLDFDTACGCMAYVGSTYSPAS